MKVEELRIGNKIGFYKPLINELQIGTISGILFDDDEGILVFVPEFSKKTWLNIEAIKPLDLTEEWLSMFNIYQIDKFYHIEGEVIYQMSEKCNQPRLTFIKHSTNDSVFLPQYALKSFQHVHELQNIYFALVGEELVLQD